MMINYKGFGRKRLWPNFKVLYLRSPGGTEENHKNLYQDSMSPGPRLEPWTSRIRSRSVNHSTKTFGWALDKRYKSRSRKLQNERLHNVCCKYDIVRMIKSRNMRWKANIMYAGKMKNVNFSRKPQRKRYHERPKNPWKDNIKTYLRESVKWTFMNIFYIPKIRTFLCQLSNYQVFMKDPAP
jgi:hypothetical protein